MWEFVGDRASAGKTVPSRDRPVHRERGEIAEEGSGRWCHLAVAQHCAKGEAEGRAQGGQVRGAENKRGQSAIVTGFENGREDRGKRAACGHAERGSKRAATAVVV